MTRSDLIEALAHPNVGAFLALIREGETNQSDDAYRMMFGGELFDAPPWQHPHKAVTVRGITSTAAGAPQFLAKTWDALVAQYGFEDFSPAMQDLGAVALIAGRKALDAVKEGRIREALRLCAREWASLPGSPYGQPTLTLERALAIFPQYGGTLADESAPQPQVQPQQVKPMAPLILPLLEIASSLIPQLGKLFGSGTEVQQRNVAAASIVADSLVQATSAVNLQDAVEKIQNDPAALAAAKQAVSDVMFTLGEAGGGGIDGARKANMSMDGPPLWARGDFWFSLLLFSIPLLLVLDVIYFHPSLWGDNPRTQVLTAGLSMLSFIGGYWLGSTVQSARKTDGLIAAATK